MQAGDHDSGASGDGQPEMRRVRRGRRLRRAGDDPATRRVGAAPSVHPATPMSRLIVGTLGVVYGDIGTSPLYTLREAFGGHALPLEYAAVLGVLSLVFWALVIVVTLKYVVVILRADNRGEGGVLALATLAQRGVSSNRHLSAPTVMLAMLGAALFYGDGVITPAISVLSAVEGLQVATPLLAPYVVPVAAVILAVLFLLQRGGTAQVGRLFGPIMVLWFLILAVLGLIEVVRHPGILRALNPLYGLALFATHGGTAFLALGAVVLAVTGAEALYADMGHFGRRPIRAAWLGFVLPSLLLNYFGQGALLIRDPAALGHPFYHLAPAWALYPLVLLATAAAIIASQAVISGAFSVTRQAVQLGFLPRLEVRHTSEVEIGQVYAPKINWLQMAMVVAVVFGFGSSSALAAAYGIAVTGAMLIDTVLVTLVAATLWHWRRPTLAAVIALFLAVDLAFFGANVLKIPSGGWFPILLAAVVFCLMSTWHEGRRILFEKLIRAAPPLDELARQLAARPPHRVPGIAVFLSGSGKVAPRALLHNLKHNKVLHERVIVATVVTEDVPRLADGERVEVEPLAADFRRVRIRYGFMERPDVPAALERAQVLGPNTDLRTASYYLSRETLIPSARRDLSAWREQIFIFLSGVALSPSDFFCLPPDRVVEVGTQVEI